MATDRLGRAEWAGNGRHIPGGYTIPVLVLGKALSLFLVISYLVCVTTYLIPGLPTGHVMLTIFLPELKEMSWPNFVLGLADSFIWGWYVALIFGPLYNFFALRGFHARMETSTDK